MQQHPPIWQTWAESLNRWGLNNLAAIFLDLLGPLNLMAAQLVYIGQPLLGQFVPEDHLGALADLLEDPLETQAFISTLRNLDDYSEA